MSAMRGSVRRVARVWMAALLLAGVGAVIALPAGTAAAATGCRARPGWVDQARDHRAVRQRAPARDNPNVPSDIQQIPALYDFLKDDGTLLSNDHTVLISHTADGILSTETGLYPDQFGGGVANTFPYLNPKAKSGTSTTSLFTYWTDKTSSSDPLYTLIHGPASASNPEGINTPAPWVPFTRAGCDFAGVGSANMEFENDTSDIANVYGSGSPQYAFGNWSYNTAYDQNFNAGSDLGETDFEGLAIHCSLADSGPGGKCSSANGGATRRPARRAGRLRGLQRAVRRAQRQSAADRTERPALAGELHADRRHAATGGQLAGATRLRRVRARTPPTPVGVRRPVHNLDANTLPAPPTTFRPGVTSTSQIVDEDGQAGFPGFDGMEANNALGYTAAAQEAGIPVTYTYISDVHDDQYGENHGNAFGPGEAGHEAAAAGVQRGVRGVLPPARPRHITKQNTLFLVTVDEGDHYDGSAPLNPGCNGVTVPCDYDTAEAGEPASGRRATPGTWVRSTTSLPGCSRAGRRHHDIRVRLR